jgi:MFS transporter, PPP family, 3-phenylpropionic acid transporter
VIPPVWRAVAAYIAVYVAVGASFPYLAVYYQGLGLSLATIGALTAMGAGIQLIAAPAWGMLSDRLRGSPIVVPAASLTAAAGATVVALAPGPAWIPVGVAIAAVGLAGILPVLDARALDAVGADRDRYGRVRAWGSAAFIVSAWLVGALIDRAGNRSLFVVYLPALAALAVVGATLRPAAEARVIHRFAGIRAVLATRPVARLLLAMLLTWSALMAVNSFFSIYLLSLGAPGALVGTAWGLGALVEIPLMWAYPALAARFGPERLLIAGASALAVRAVGTVLVTDPTIAVGLMVFSGIGFAFVYVGAVTYVSRRTPPGTAATAQGLLTATSFGLASIVGAGIGGSIAGILGIRGMYALAAAASVAAILVVALATRTTPEVREPAAAVPEPG